MRPIKSNLSNEKIAQIQESNALLLDPEYFDQAIVDYREGVAVYSYELLIKAFSENEDCTNEEAEEWINYNTVRSLPYIDNSPVIE